jgi:hypothetical protein
MVHYTLIAIAKANGLYVFNPTNNSSIRTWTTAYSSLRSSAVLQRTALPLSSRSRRRAPLVPLISSLVLRPASVDIDCGSLCPDTGSGAVCGRRAACNASRPPSSTSRIQTHGSPALLAVRRKHLRHSNMRQSCQAQGLPGSTIAMRARGHFNPRLHECERTMRVRIGI